MKECKYKVVKYILTSFAKSESKLVNQKKVDYQVAVDKFQELSNAMRRQMYIADIRYRDLPHDADASNISAGPFTTVDPEVHTYNEVGPSSYPTTYPVEGSQISITMGQSQPMPTFDLQYRGSEDAYDHQSHSPVTPSPYGMHTSYFMPPDEDAREHPDVQVQHQLRDRPIRPPDHYTPGTDALPHVYRRRRR